MEIEVINEIQRILAAAKQDVIEMPMIVSLGDQSSGKSSVIERVMGRDVLPKGSGIVTKRPLILQMTKTTDNQETFRFAHNNKVYTNSLDVMQEIVDETERVCSKEPSGISSIPINLTFYSPKVIDLTLVDLPGLTKIATKGQDDSIVENIFKMVRDFVEKENTLILAVIPANNDIANSGALSMIKRVDPEGKRSIACITKIDLMDKGTDCLSILKNEQYHLEKGYIGLVNRNQAQIKNKISYEESIKLETQFFREHPVYSSVADRCGTLYLRQYLSEQLVKHIKKCSKNLSMKMNIKLKEVTADVFDLKNQVFELSTTNGTSFQLKSLSYIIEPLLDNNSTEWERPVSKIDDYINDILKCHQIISKEYLNEAMEVASPTSDIIESKNNELSLSMFDSAFLIAGAIANQQILMLDSVHDTYINKYIDTFEKSIYSYFNSLVNQPGVSLIKPLILSKFFKIRQSNKELCKDILKTFQFGFLPKIPADGAAISKVIPVPLSQLNNNTEIIECNFSRRKDRMFFQKKHKLLIKYQSIAFEKEDILKPNYYSLKTENTISKKKELHYYIKIHKYGEPEPELVLNCASALEQSQFISILVDKGFLDRSHKAPFIILNYEKQPEFQKLINQKGAEHALKHFRLYVEVYLIISEQIKSLIFTLGKTVTLSVMEEMKSYLSGRIYADFVADNNDNSEFNAIKKQTEDKYKKCLELQQMYKDIIEKMKRIT